MSETLWSVLGGIGFILLIGVGAYISYKSYSQMYSRYYSPIGSGYMPPNITGADDFDRLVAKQPNAESEPPDNVVHLPDPHSRDDGVTRRLGE